MKTDTQNSQIIKHLESGLSLTAYGALKKFGCLRLSGRIHELKSQGYDIRSEMIELQNGKHVARYSLEKEPELTVV